MSLFKTEAELTLKPHFFDLAYRVRDYAYRLSCVSSAYVLKSDMESSFPVDAVRVTRLRYEQGWRGRPKVAKPLAGDCITPLSLSPTIADLPKDARA